MTRGPSLLVGAPWRPGQVGAARGPSMAAGTGFGLRRTPEVRLAASLGSASAVSGVTQVPKVRSGDCRAERRVGRRFLASKGLSTWQAEGCGACTLRPFRGRLVFRPTLAV